MDHSEAQAFAAQWVKDWNAHDVNALLAHFTDDVVFTSPVAVRLLGGDGVIRGKEALRAYWSEGIRLIPDLHFEVVGVYAGIATLVINYRNQAGGLVSEVLTFDGDLVREGHGTYLIPASSLSWRRPAEQGAQPGGGAVNEAPEYEEGGEPVCLAHLLCPDCGAVRGDGHRAGCQFAQIAPVVVARTDDEGERDAG
jgi:hypothetical protein